MAGILGLEVQDRRVDASPIRQTAQPAASDSPTLGVFVNLDDVTSTIPMATRAGLTVEVMERGRARVRVPFEGNGNHFGTMYAGGPFLASEIVGGVLIVGTYGLDEFFPLLTGLDMRWTAVATTDVTVEVTMSTDRIEELADEARDAGKARFTLDTEVLDTNGAVVATGIGHYQLRTLGNIPS